jgi:multidrug resistance efflux pump
MNNKAIFGIGAAAILLLAWWFNSGGDEKAADILVSPKTGLFEVRVMSSGELKASNSTEIMGPQGARSVGIWRMQIEKIIPEGTVVDSGDFVADLDKSELLGKIQDAELQLQKVQSQYTQTQLDTSLTLSQARDELINLGFALEERQLELNQSQYESPSVIRQAEINLDKSRRAYEQAKSSYVTRELQAKAKMDEVQADLSKEKNRMKDYQRVMREFTVRAPEKGMVVYRREYDGKKRNVGSQVSPWDPVVAELPDLTNMETITYINEVDIQKISKGQEVNIGLDAMPEKILSGNVTSVANIGEERPNTDSKVFEVIVSVNETDTTLRPAMTTSTNILVYSEENALFVPLETVFSNDEYSYVFKKDGLSAVRQQVDLGRMNENEVIIERGVRQKDELYLSMPADTSGMSWNLLEPEPIASSDDQ